MEEWVKFECCQGVMEEMEREKEESRGERLDPEEQAAQRNLFMKDGRPYNINDAKLGFSVKDERCYLLLSFYMKYSIILLARVAT